VRLLAFALVPLASVAGAVALLAPRDRGTPETVIPKTVLDHRAADFLEDEEGSRVVAALEAVLVREDEETRIEIRASAVGPRVDPARGASGIRGGNAISTEEIAAILAGRRAEVRVNGATVGAVATGRCGAVIERRLDEQGRLAHVAARGAGPLEAVFSAPIDERDEVAEIEVVVDGRTRVRAQVRDRGTRIARLEGVAAHGRGAKP